MVKCYKSEPHPRTKFHISARVREQLKPLRMHAPVYPRLGAPRAGLPNLLEQMREHVRRQALLEIAYARGSLPAAHSPQVTSRVSRFLQAKFGKDRKSKRRLPWDESSMWHYWIEGCLANSNTRFRKFFRLCRARFDEIYEAAALSGQFVLNPAEPLYAKACPPLPPGSDGRHVAQHTKVPPLCMRIAAFMRRLATGESFDSLEASFNISRPVLQKFFLVFAAWFDKEYYVPYIGGISGVGFDTRTEIVESERLFRSMGLPGTLTCMDAVHMAYENAPYPSRHLFIGKEGYPTVGVNMHSNAIGWIKYVGAIFPGAHNDKTAVRFDKLVQAMRTDPLFTTCSWSTAVPFSQQENMEIRGCMSLCDGGYHRWSQTMCAMKHPTTQNQGRFSTRYTFHPIFCCFSACICMCCLYIHIYIHIYNTLLRMCYRLVLPQHLLCPCIHIRMYTYIRSRSLSPYMYIYIIYVYICAAYI